jgi:hypothetical protein
MEKRDTRRRFEQWVRNPECEANAVSAILGVRMADVAAQEGLTPSIGQSPFALQRGQRFEGILFKNNAKLLRAELEKAEVLPTGSKGFRDLRMRAVGGECADLDEAVAETLKVFGAIAKNGVKGNPTLVAGATICVPGRAMLPEAILVLDVLAIGEKDRLPELVVGEIKTYPDRGGYTDSIELAGTRAQSGVYLHGLKVILRDNGLTDRIQLSNTGFLVLTKPGSNRPSVRAREDLQYQAARAERGLEKLRELSVRKDLPNANHTEQIAIVLGAETHYQEGCIRYCDRAAGCFKRALADGNPAILGDDVAELVRTMPLERVRALLDGAKPKTQAELEIAKRIATGARR